ncbi:MAG: hypothetical protein QNL68_18390 [Akkermansiaceae bacterium]
MILSRSLPILCASLLTAGAQDRLTPFEDKVAKDEEHEKNTHVRDRIPAGAVLTNFSVPRFNKEKKRVSLLTAQEMVVDSPKILRGSGLKLRMFDDQENIRSVATIANARYLLDDEQLHGTGEIIVREKNDEFYARSQGGIFSLDTGQALMLGPAQTMFLIPDKKTAQMNLKSTLPFAALVQLLVATPPPELTAKELADFERNVAPRMLPVFNGPKLMEKADAKNKSLEQHLAEYLTTVGKRDLLLQIAAPPVAEEEDPLKDLFEENPDRIFISASKGIYFDGTTYELVYLGNIKFKGQGITMTCNQDLKVIFDPPPVEKKEDAPAEKEGNPLSSIGGVGELKQFTASGNLRISGIKDGEKFYMSGDRAVYDKAKSQIILRGDLMAFALDQNAMRSNSKNAYAVINLEDNGDMKINFSDDWYSVLSVPKRDKKK